MSAVLRSAVEGRVKQARGYAQLDELTEERKDARKDEDEHKIDVELQLHPLLGRLELIDGRDQGVEQLSRKTLVRRHRWERNNAKQTTVVFSIKCH